MALTKEDLQAIAELLDQKLEEKLEQKLEEKLDQKLEEKLDQKLEKKLAPINNRLDKLESQVNALRVGQIEIGKEIKVIDIKVSETHELALDAWGTSTENRKWLESAN